MAVVFSAPCLAFAETLPDYAGVPDVITGEDIVFDIGDSLLLAQHVFFDERRGASAKSERAVIPAEETAEELADQVGRCPGGAVLRVGIILCVL